MRISLGQSDTGGICPSLEQLEGIVDLNDPCQSGFSSLPLTTTPAINPVTGGIIPSMGASAASTTSASPTASVSSGLLIGGAVVFGLLLMMMVARK